MNPILQKPLLLLDGGLGTTLEDQCGITFSEDTPLWSSHLLVSSPETLLETQRRFAEAGADVIITASYQASFEGFARTAPGIGPKLAENYMRSAVEISRKAFNGHSGLVALSLGAYGAIMIPSQEYGGEYDAHMLTAEELYQWHWNRLQVFRTQCWRDIDIIAFETLPRLSEVRAARLVMQRLPERKPYWISCVFPNDDRLPDGSTIREVMLAMLDGDHQPFAVGINCTKLHRMSNLIQKFEAAAESLPRLVIYPDGAGGLRYNPVSYKWVGDGGETAAWDEQVAQLVEEVRNRGRWKGILVGGCCKTTPEHIAKLKRRLDQVS